MLHVGYGGVTAGEKRARVERFVWTILPELTAALSKDVAP